MRVFVINLDADKERLADIGSQLRSQGVDYERVPAVYGRDLAEDAKRDAVASFRSWCAIGRRLRDGEIGCAMSHYGVFRKMAEAGVEGEGTCFCVLEDDAMLSPDFKRILDYVDGRIVRSRPQVVLLSCHAAAEMPKGDAREASLQRSRGDRFAEAYVITANAASAILHENWPLQVPCDYWERWARDGTIELFHAFPTCASQNRAKYGSKTIQGAGMAVSDYPLPKYVLHKAMRAIGKTIDGIIRLMR